MGLAGQTIRIRFRIGTDEAVGDFGWALDNLSFQGITNTPFSTLVADGPSCRQP
jgi:large repetitive protein